MAWFRKDKKPLKAEDRRDVPTDVFDKCKGCGEIQAESELRRARAAGDQLSIKRATVQRIR